MMLRIEEIVCEEEGGYGEEGGLPPGFRFHPTDEELITFYLASKVFNTPSSSSSSSPINIVQLDLNRCEPWQLPDVAKMGEREWYFYSVRDRKYPTGLRTNRATVAGYWKATGKDRQVYSGTNGSLLGMKKTLVFYKGRAPRGEKTKWVMHEYRLDGHFTSPHACKEEWVICRIYEKMGEKKNAIMVEAGQNYPTLKTLTSSSLNLAAIPSFPQNPMMYMHHHQQQCSEKHKSIVFHHQQNDLINHHYPLLSHTNNLLGGALPINHLLSSSFSSPKTTTKKTNTKSSSSKLLDGNNTTLLKSLISHQDLASSSKYSAIAACTTDTATATAVGPCKTEAAIAPCLFPDPNVCCTKYQNNTMFYGMGMMGASDMGLGGINTFDEMSNSFEAFTRTCSQMVDPPIQFTADSWPMDL